MYYHSSHKSVKEAREFARKLNKKYPHLHHHNVGMHVYYHHKGKKSKHHHHDPYEVAGFK